MWRFDLMDEFSTVCLPVQAPSPRKSFGRRRWIAPAAVLAAALLVMAI